MQELETESGQETREALITYTLPTPTIQYHTVTNKEHLKFSNVLPFSTSISQIRPPPSQGIYWNTVMLLIRSSLEAPSHASDQLQDRTRQSLVKTRCKILLEIDLDTRCHRAVAW